MTLRKRRSRYSVGAVRSGKSELAILDAAAYLLRKRGVEGLTVEAVARKARAGKPTIYRWWRTKTQLMFDAFLRSSPVRAADPDVGNVRDELQVYFENLWKLWADPRNAEISCRLLSESLSEPELRRAYFEDYIPRREAPFGDIMKRAMQRGELPSNLDLEQIARLFSSFHVWSVVSNRPASSQTIRWVIDMVLNTPPLRTASQTSPAEAEQEPENSPGDR